MPWDERRVVGLRKGRKVCGWGPGLRQESLLWHTADNSTGQTVESIPGCPSESRVMESHWRVVHGWEHCDQVYVLKRLLWLHHGDWMDWYQANVKLGRPNRRLLKLFTKEVVLSWWCSRDGEKRIKSVDLVMGWIWDEAEAGVRLNSCFWLTQADVWWCHSLKWATLILRGKIIHMGLTVPRFEVYLNLVKGESICGHCMSWEPRRVAGLRCDFVTHLSLVLNSS